MSVINIPQRALITNQYKAKKCYPSVIPSGRVWLFVMNITKKLVCAPIATLLLTGTLIGGADAAALVTWTIVDSTTATATMTDSTVITATASAGSTFGGLHESTDGDWGGDFGNSFFAPVPSGNGLDVHDANGGVVSFSFSSATSNLEFWYSNAIVDLALDTPFAAILLNESTQVGLTMDNTTGSSGAGNPVQSAGILSLAGSVSGFTVTGAAGSQELVRYGIVDRVPEPSSTLMFGLGVFAFVLRRARR